MKTTISRYFMVPVGLLLLVLTGCGSSDGQGTSATTASSQQMALTAEDIATTKAIENAVASLDTGINSGALSKTVLLTSPVAGEQKVFGKSVFVVPKSGSISFSKTFNGLVDGAQGTLVFYNSFGKDIPTTACTGTATQIKVCQASRKLALAWNPTSVQVALNGQTVIAPNQITRTQGKAFIPVTVNKINNQLQIALTGPAYSFIQLEVWSQPTAPVPMNPTADFTFTVPPGQSQPPSGLTVPVVIVFDASPSSTPNGTITSYAWDFGDGTTGTSVVTDHLFGDSGTYSIVLTVTDSAAKTATKTTTIVVSDPILPVANFTYKIDSSTGIPIFYVDGGTSSSANGAIVTWVWEWGDNTIASLGKTSSHTYLAPGPYLVTLHVADNLGNTNISTQLITIPAGPFANFTVDRATGTIPMDVLFDARLSSTLSGSIVSYNWDFGDGSSYVGFDNIDQGLRIFEAWHTYTTAGTYPVTLTVTDSAGNSATKTVSVTANAPLPLNAAFTYTVDTSTGEIIVTADASGSSTPNGIITSYVWDFGDGAGSFGGAITTNYTYFSAGTYNITLTVWDSAGINGSVTHAITVP